MEPAPTSAMAEPAAALGSRPVVPGPKLEAWRALLNAHAALVERMEVALAGEQLPPLGWYDVLSALHRAPDRRLRPRDLGLHLTISKSGLTRLVDRIVAAGLIERRACPSDRRGHLIVLTEAGERMLQKMRPVYGGALAASFAERMSDEEADALRGLLERLIAGACA